MNIYNDLNDLPEFENAVVTIGSFDGVHLGHRQLLAKIKSLANKVDGEDVVVTFHPHPRSVINPKDDSLKLLNELQEKMDLLEEFGISNCVIVPFTLEFSQQSPKDYIENFIIKSLRPKILVVGYDHKYGYKRQGDFDLLQSYAVDNQFELFKIDKEEIDNIAISSTKIRKSIERGDVAIANKYLSYNYYISGVISKGKQIGTKLGFPTANIEVELKSKLIPKVGVYSCTIKIDQNYYSGMAYIGKRPSVEDDDKIKVEVNIFNFNADIYGKQASVSFINRIRDDIKFSNLEALKSQLEIDKINVSNDLGQRESNIYHTTLSKTNSSNVAVVILNFNGEKVLKKYLSSLYNSSSKYPFDLIVIDNGSTDNSIAYLENFHPKVQLIKLPNNLGFAGGYNEGLKNLNYKYFALVNSDIEGTSNWLDPLINELEQKSHVGIVQPKIRAIHNRAHFEYAGAAGGFIDALGYPFCRGRIFNTIEKDNGQYDSNLSVDWATGAAFVIRSQLYNLMQGFDKDYFAHMEEIDLCIRVKRLGLEIKAIPESVVYHLGGGTLNYESPKKTYLNFRNNLATLIKNYPTIQLIIIFPVRLILDGFAGLKYLFEGNIKNFVAIIKAHFSVYKDFTQLISKRRSLNKFYQSQKVKGLFISNSNVKSIVIQYYLIGKKKFSDL